MSVCDMGWEHNTSDLHMICLSHRLHSYHVFDVCFTKLLNGWLHRPDEHEIDLMLGLSYGWIG